MPAINKRFMLILLLRQRKQREAEQQRSLRRFWVRPIFTERILKGAWFCLIPRLRETDTDLFINYLRMSPSKFDKLLSIVSPRLKKYSRRDSISPGERLAITLRYLASGNDMRSISYQFLVSPNTVGRIISETCNVLWDELLEIVFPPVNTNAWLAIASDFENLWNFPHCLGAIDGKHVVVQAFGGSGSENLNYKNTNSVVLLAVADAKYKFVSVDIGAPGRCSDGGVLKASLIGKKLDNGTLSIPPPDPLAAVGNVPYFFVGDSAFPLKSYLMKPFSGKFLPDEQIIFNYRLSRARRVVENAFGILAARWRIYRRPINASHSTVKAIIKATVCLHNWLLQEDNYMQEQEMCYAPPRLVDGEDAQGHAVHGQWREQVGTNCAIQNVPSNMRMGARNFAAAPAEYRDRLVNYFLERGQVDWQWQLLPEVW